MKIIDQIIHTVFPGHDVTWEERAVVLTLLGCISVIGVFAGR